VTFEHHLVPLSIIKALEVAGVKVRPGSQTLEYSREKLSPKESIDFDYIINVQVARSPHAQATTWAPTQVLKSDGKCMMTISPAPLLSAAMSEQAQKIALDAAAEVKLVGVMSVEMLVKGDEMFIEELILNPHNSVYWTI
jgi:5-(carboxyamino)imidazole ribonucleotide synthase